jgi:Icc-related predicted phosphoesterase
VKILCIADEELTIFWDSYVPGRLKEYDLILSSGDLKAAYLSFIVTMARVPVLYVHGNHDTGYQHKPPEGCDCIEDQLIVYNGLRILGLGGCRRYCRGDHQYTDREMSQRIRKLRWKLWWHKGVDIVVTHAPPAGVGDDNDPPHRGFEAFLKLVEKYKPKYLLHGHVHMNYSMDNCRVRQLDQTQVINVYERYVLDIPEDDT